MMKKFSVILMMCSVFGHLNADPLAITEFNVETIDTFSSDGKVIATVPVSSLPKTNIPVMEINDDLDLVAIEDNTGQIVWLDTYFVKLNQGKKVDLPCYKIGHTDAKDSREAGTMGFGGACENAN